MGRIYFSSLIFLVALGVAISQPSVVPAEEPADCPKPGNNSAGYPLPNIYEMLVTTNVSNRFAHTLVITRVENLSPIFQDSKFSVVLPKTAYITDFVLETGACSFASFVMEKAEAEKIYNTSKDSGSGGLASARDSNHFVITISLGPHSNATFFLTYEELLVRRNNLYEVILNVHPGQTVCNMVLQVNINESRLIKFLGTPSLQSGFDENDSPLETTLWNHTFATVTFIPTVETQVQLGISLGIGGDAGLAGQLVVRYDVERDSEGGEVLIQDGWFVHFFSPDGLEPLPTQVIFVLDTSGSMSGSKLTQLKQAMTSILSQLQEGDAFNLVEFNTPVYVYDVVKNTNVVYRNGDRLENIQFPVATPVTPANIKLATDVVGKMGASGNTYIYGALEVALRLLDLACTNSSERQPLVMFLTDGQPTIGITDPKEIIQKISEIKRNMSVCVQKAPLFGLSLGEDADKDFLNELSLKNQGYWTHIYDATDTSIQLINFYKQISTPVLLDVNFTYASGGNFTRTSFPMLFQGSELVVAGQFDGDFPATAVVQGRGVKGVVEFKPVVGAAAGQLERLWGYLTEEQTFEAMETVENTTAFEQTAVDVAVKYSFVTTVSSLVVVTPSWVAIVNPVVAEVGTKHGNGSIPLTEALGLTITADEPDEPSSAVSNFRVLLVQVSFVFIVSVTVGYF